MLNSDTKYKLSDKALFQKVVDETVILDSISGQYYTLDPIGTEMIEALNTGQSVSQVVALIEQNYDATVDNIQADLSELIDTMSDKGLLEEA
ncbi:PqqD family protein [Aliiglaciecola sp. 3_MG-2023]|uniref:PqqD family protein n=1 Tax=unclassified Aliiglaciecola TaxID=2593648 RepID=UPI0026E47F10|nr:MULTISPECIES: PqqD family protein [unclassified Aliiglaciecola]MDO6693215.1 PqqD family protein [Aliiglaciecola sp. 3_MG-2023]MDO6712894.1 PqqD family protein [Aliiglaciecola sp. 2_MG-2023]MDO6752870.1 PqqD family protein [Aliiglaciecola sp. 1_MG-2023]